MSQLVLRFQRDIKSIIYFAISLFIGLSLISFSPKDPSFNSTGYGSGVENFCGYFGSFLSDLLYQVFGLAAWLIVIGLARVGYRTLQGNKTSFTKTRLGLNALLFVVITALVALYFPQTRIFSNSIYVGGLLGLVISKALIAVFNTTGVAVILWAAAIVLFIFFTEHTIDENVQSVVGLLRKLSLDGVAQKIAASIGSRQKVTVGTVAEDKKIQEKKLLSLLDKYKDDKASDGIPEDAAEKQPEESATPSSFVIRSIFDFADNKAQKTMKEMKRRVENWELPKLAMLETATNTKFRVDEKVIKRNTLLLEDKLSQFDVNGKVVAVLPGPAVTMFEFKPNADVKISKITELADDLSLAMSSESVRIIAPLPGRDVVGIETANYERDTVYLSEILEDVNFWEDEIKLPLALGKQANGETRIVDLRKMPHMLVAGTTGSGKSVFINSILTGLLFKHSPKTLRLILVDPKQVDLATFHKVPHLIMPPIKEPKKAVNGLRWAVREMEKRYRSMSRFNARGIEGFNEKVKAIPSDEVKAHQKMNEELETQRRDTTEGYYFTELPYIVIVVEEFGDLMTVDKANVEQMIVRLAQMARACGIHLILAMQSPRRDVVTGLIKTNIPGRVSFKVASKMDSRIILDESGAERLLATGDMLFLAPGVSKPQRHHGAWISEDEMTRVTAFWSKQGEPDFDSSAMKSLDGSGGGFDLGGSDEEGFDEGNPELEERYDEILAYVSTMKEVSASLLQRKFRLGYPRAARVIEIFEKEGVVGPANGSKPRQVLINKL